MIVVLVLVGGGVAFFLVKSGVSLPGVSQVSVKPKVSVASGNRNPFSKESQYVNPFSPSKNPFATFNK